MSVTQSDVKRNNSDLWFLGISSESSKFFFSSEGFPHSVKRCTECVSKQGDRGALSVSANRATEVH